MQSVRDKLDYLLSMRQQIGRGGIIYGDSLIFNITFAGIFKEVWYACGDACFFGGGDIEYPFHISLLEGRTRLGIDFATKVELRNIMFNA